MKEKKNNCCLFEKVFRVKMNGVFLFGTLEKKQSLSLKNQIAPFATIESGTDGLALNTHGSDIVLNLAIRLLGVDDPGLDFRRSLVCGLPSPRRGFRGGAWAPFPNSGW